MPFFSRSNNALIPSNQRSVDVARATLDKIIPIQQRKYANAFAVEGYETVVYNKLWTGQRCSCQAHRSVSAGLLDQDGKLDAGTMNQILSGGLEFKVNQYGSRSPMRPDLRAIRGVPPKERDDQFFDGLEDVTEVPGFDIVDSDLTNPFANTVENEGVGTNGQTLPTSLDDVAEEFDAEAFINDTKCTVCFGTGFVGGYSVLNGLRLILSTQYANIKNIVGTIETNQSPHAFMSTSVSFNVTLPKGIIGLDAFRLWNNDLHVPMETVLIDGLAFSVQLLMALCDGQSHVITVNNSDLTYWTHLEMQFNLSKTPALFELPKLNEGSNMMLEDATDDLSINASPAIPSLRREDVLVESTFGKALMIHSSNFWNDKKRNVLGWDVQTRVIQPSELLNMLPRRNLTRQVSTFMTRDNSAGIKRS